MPVDQYDVRALGRCVRGRLLTVPKARGRKAHCRVLRKTQAHGATAGPELVSGVDETRKAAQYPDQENAHEERVASLYSMKEQSDREVEQMTEEAR